MTITLHGHKAWSCTQRVLVVLLELNLPYVFIHVDYMADEHKSAAYLAKHPFGVVPYLEDDGFVVYESRAICKYIAKKYAGHGTKLMPDDGDFEGYGLFEQACSIEMSYFHGPSSGIGYERIFKAQKGQGSPDENAVKAYGEKLDAKLAVYETILSKQRYLGGNELTLADLFQLPYGASVNEQGFWEIFGKYSCAKKWWDGLEGRESWGKVLAEVEDEK